MPQPHTSAARTCFLPKGHHPRLHGASSTRITRCPGSIGDGTQVTGSLSLAVRPTVSPSGIGRPLATTMPSRSSVNARASIAGSRGCDLQQFGKLQLAHAEGEHTGATWSGRLLPRDVVDDLQPVLDQVPASRAGERYLDLLLRQGDFQLRRSLDDHLPIARDGIFHLTGLSAGIWQVARQREGTVYPLGEMVLHAGRETRQDLGAPWPLGSLDLSSVASMPAGKRVGTTRYLRTDAQGHVQARCFAGPQGVALNVHDDLGSPDMVLVADPLLVAPGEPLRAVVDVHLLHPRLSVLLPDSSPAAGVQLVFANSGMRGAATLAARQKARGPESGRPVEFPLTLATGTSAAVEVRLLPAWHR